MKSTLILGGIRSGKSLFAENLLKNNTNVTYVATARAFDSEMQERINKHRERRNPDWMTVEVPIKLAGTISLLSNRTLLVESLGTWLSNLFLEYQEDWNIMTKIRRNIIGQEISKRMSMLADAVQKHEQDIVLVSEEVGLSLVSDYSLGRLFEDKLGELNQRIAQQCDEVILVVAGYPVYVKKEVLPQ